MCCTWLAANTGRKNDPKNRHLGTIAQRCRAISSQLRHISTVEKKLLSSNISSICFHNMVNFGLLASEIGPVVWGTPANFNGFGVLGALPHGTPVVGVGQTLRRGTEGATYVRQGDHHVGHWPTFLVLCLFCVVWSSCLLMRVSFCGVSFFSATLSDWLGRASSELLLLLHPFNGLSSRTTWVNRHRKGKPFWILLEQEMMG